MVMHTNAMQWHCLKKLLHCSCRNILEHPWESGFNVQSYSNFVTTRHLADDRKLSGQCQLCFNLTWSRWFKGKWPQCQLCRADGWMHGGRCQLVLLWLWRCQCPVYVCTMTASHKGSGCWVVYAIKNRKKQL